jgi:hypothetical protein
MGSAEACGCVPMRFFGSTFGRMPPRSRLNISCFGRNYTASRRKSSPCHARRNLGGAAATGDASAVIAGSARVLIPRPKPVVVPDTAGNPLPTPPAVVSSGDLY